MLASIVRASLQRRGVVMLLALLLLGYGSFRLSTASLDIFPEFAAKRVIIQTEAAGLTPEQVEKLVTQPIEKSLTGLLGLESIGSESLQGLSVVTVVFRDDSEIFRNRQLVAERLSTMVGQLPPGIGPPLPVPLSSASATVLTFGLSSDRQNLMELRSLADWTVAPRLLAVPGVADVNVFGGEIKQLQIQIQPDKLHRFGLGIDDVLRAAEQATSMLGAGFLDSENQRISLQISGLPDTAQQLQDVLLLRKDGVNVVLGDVAVVTVAPRPPISAAAINGKPAIVMMVIGQYDANTLSISRGLDTALSEFEPIFAKQGIRLHTKLFRPADYIERSLRNLSVHLLIGGVLVLLVLYAFLYNWRTACIAALAIPLSLMGAAVVLLELGVNLNIMILGGLAIVLGEVVDDAIIDTENIFRRLRENKHSAHPLSPFRTVFAASLEVRSSVVYASFIIALAFVPLLTLHGVAGRLFAPLGQAYIVAILVSLAVALTITPALSLALLPSSDLRANDPPLVRLILPAYSALLRRIAARPQLAAGFSVVACLLALALIPGLGAGFLPELREGHYIVHTSLLPGTSLQEAMRVGNRLTEQFRAIPGVESTSQWAGRAERGSDTYGSHYSEYDVRLQTLTGSQQHHVLERLREILKNFPGLQYEANTFLVERIEETISGYTSPVVVNLYGDDLTQLELTVREIAALMSKIEGSVDIQLRSPSGLPLLQIRLRLDQLASFGIRPLEAAKVIQTAYDGQVVGKVFENSRYYDVALILDPRNRRQVDSVAALPLKTPEGVNLTLGQIADIQQIGGRYNILHRSGQRVQTVTCQVAGRDLQSFLDELRRRVRDEIKFAPETYPEFTGAAIEQGHARRDLLVHSMIAGAGILILIYIAIGNLRNTLLTLSNLPFSLIGGLVGAHGSGAVLSVGSMVGFITLFGITVRNTIMLISHYQHLVEQEGHRWELATVIQGARERLPSILMTALVTGLAMLPIAINSDNPGREIMGPMATIIIGGLFSSTLLNLLLLPAILWRYGEFRCAARELDGQKNGE